MKLLNVKGSLETSALCYLFSAFPLYNASLGLSSFAHIICMMEQVVIWMTKHYTAMKFQYLFPLRNIFEGG